MIPLEKLVKSTITDELEKDVELGGKLSVEGFDRLKREDLEDYKTHKVKQKINYVYRNSKFYRDLYDGEGVKRDIEGLRGLRNFPTLEATDVENNTFEILCTFRSNILRGYTIDQLRILYTEEELKHAVDSIAAGLETAGVEEGGTLQIMLPQESDWGCPSLIERALEKLGGHGEVTGQLPLEDQLEKMREIEPSSVLSNHPYVYQLVEGSEQMSEVDLRKFDLGSIVLSRGCVCHPFNESKREMLENAWGCKVFDHYGTVETDFGVAIECEAQDGLHVNEADFLLEVIDPETEERLEPGEKGELVVTTLNRKGFPLIRYRLGDLARIINKKCNCGSNLQRIADIEPKLKDRVYQIGRGAGFF